MANSAASAQPKMVVENATKFYATKSGSVHALEDVSLEVREGEFLCILGPSGCGKTTLLWSMAGLHDLTSGRIRLGAEIDHPAASRDRDDLSGRQSPAVAQSAQEHRASRSS